MRDNPAATLVKWAAVMFFGLGFQRMALASQGVIALSGDSANSGGIAAAPAVITPPPTIRPQSGLIKIAQAGDYGGDFPATQEATAPDLSATPQVSEQESINTIRQSSSMHRRRKPKMAGVPSGLQTVEQSPESDINATQQVAQESERTVITNTQSIPLRTVPQTGNSVAQGGGETENENAAEDMDSPGAMARRHAAASQTDLSSRKYRLAPIKWGGTISDTVGVRNNITLPSPANRILGTSEAFRARQVSTYHVQSVMVGGQTYIIQPWIATVIGRIGLVSGTQDVVNGAQNSNGDRRTSLFGGGDLALFNRSRFPASMRFDVQDNRDVSNTVANDNNGTSSNATITKKLQINQIYRHPDEITDYRANYKYENLVDLLGGPYVLNTTSSTLEGTVTTKVGRQRDQPFNLIGYYRDSSNSITGQSSLSLRSESITATHIWRPEDSLWALNSRGSFFSSSSPQLSTQNIMASTQGSWQPESEDNPLVVRGGMQFSGGQSEQPGVSASKTESLSANVALAYPAWVDRKIAGGGTVAIANSSGTSSLSTSLYGRGDYYPAAIHFGKASYSRVFNTGFQNQTTSGSRTDVNVYGGASHSLSSPFMLTVNNYKSTISSSISQSLTVNLDSLTGNSETLTHKGAVSWAGALRKSKANGFREGVLRERSTGSAGMNARIGLQAYDTITRGGLSPGHTKMVDLTTTISGLGDFMSDTSAQGYGASGDFNIRATYFSGKKSLTAVGTGAWGTQYAYKYKLKKPKFLGKKGLDYNLTFNASANANVMARRYQSLVSGPGTGGSLGTTSSTAGHGIGYQATLDQSLRYRVGQNEALLTATLADNYGIKTASLFLQLRAWRNFGN